MSDDFRFCLSLANPALPLDVAVFGCTRPGPEWALRDRTLSEHYLACWMTGQAECVVDGRKAVMGPGSAWWITPGVAHSARALDQRRGFRFFHLRFSYPGGISSRALVLLSAAGLVPRFAALREAWCTRDPLAATFRLQLGALCAEFLRLSQESENGLPHALRSRLLAWVAVRLPRPIHPRELAAQAGMSLDWFTRRFRASFGLSPRTWLMHERIRWAADLMAGGSGSMASVASQAGFANPALFSRQFRQVMGTSPGAWAVRHNRS